MNMFESNLAPCAVIYQFVLVFAIPLGVHSGVGCRFEEFPLG